MISLVPSAVCTSAVEKLASLALDRLLKDLEPGIVTLEQRIANLQFGIELQHAMWLKAAMSFLQLGDLDQARDDLVRAEASDPRSAVARLYLGIVLARQGRAEIARERLSDALNVNPFVTLGTGVELFEGSQPVEARAQRWERHLNAEGFNKSLPRPEGVIARLLSPVGDGGAVESVSTSSGTIVCRWGVSDNFSGDPTQMFLSAIDMVTGRTIWTLRMDDAELYFATPAFTVLKCQPPSPYRFHSTRTGEPVGDMGSTYFETVFCPDRKTVEATPAFLRANCTMVPPADVLNRKIEAEKAEEAKLGFWKRLFSPGFKYACEDTRDLFDPFGLGLFHVKVKNVWSAETEYDSVGEAVVSHEAVHGNAYLERMA
jgi:hypothetical protein